MLMLWVQNYDPLGNAALSTILAALPVIVLLGSIALGKVPIHWAATLGLAAAVAIAIGMYRMPASLAGGATLLGALYGLFPIGWIILNLIFLYQLTVESGSFQLVRSSLAGVAPDPRIQVILIAFCFGAFFEGAAGFGTPVAVTAAILIQLGFHPLAASGLSLIANTAPVAFGALGTPVITLSKVTDLDLHHLSAMVGRQLPFFSVLVPFWVVCAMAGWRGMFQVWPAALVAGVSFAIPQFLVSNFHGPWLVDIVASLCSMGALVLLLRVWKPSDLYRGSAVVMESSAVGSPATRALMKAWAPWILLSLFVFAWGVPAVKSFLNGQEAFGSLRLSQSVTAPQWHIPSLHENIRRAPPVAPADARPETADFSLNWLSATGTGILLSALIAGKWLGFSWRSLGSTYVKTLYRIRFSLWTIAAMLTLGHVTKFSGADATLGLALAKTGALYPFFGTLLGWLGVALTGSDTASNVLFGGLQKITAQQTGLDPTLMAAANSSGGVMGKMVDAQSIVVASTATNWYGKEGTILRYVFFHSLALASLVGILVTLQAYVFPFTTLVKMQGKEASRAPQGVRHRAAAIPDVPKDPFGRGEVRIPGTPVK